MCSFSNLDFVATSFCVSKRLLKPDQTKKKLRKFLDAMIQKSGKIRCLVREINDSYSKSDLLQKSRRQLEEELQKLDSQYDACNTVMLRGEVNGFQPEWGFSVPCRCSAACSAEAKTRYLPQCIRQPASMFLISIDPTMRNAKKYEKKDADLSPGENRKPTVKQEKNEKNKKEKKEKEKKEKGRSKHGKGKSEKPLAAAFGQPTPCTGPGKPGSRNVRLGGDTVSTDQPDAARGVVSDIGETAAEASSGLIELSRCTLSNSERDVEQVSRKYNLQLPVPIREIQKSPGVRYSGNFHVIALESWLQFIIDHNVWHMLLGLHNADPKRERALLREFWRLYRLAEPDHQVWAEIEKHGIKVEHLLPVVMHGDEGRGRKRGPFLVTSYHSMIGFGTVLANANRKTKSYLQLRLNYVGSTHSSRMITGCLPKMHKDEQALDDLLTFMTGDCLRSFQQGVTGKHGERYHAACLNAVGDWAWLQKCGHLERSYLNIPKKALVQTSKPKGICHLCHAGRLEHDFEDLSLNPSWLQTMYCDEPWTVRPVLLHLAHCPSRPADFFSYDLWHAFHLGMAKSFAASTLARITDRFPESTVDSRFERLTSLFLTFADEHREPTYITALTKESCGWYDRKTYPNGQWSKGHVSTVLLRFLQSYFARFDVSDDIILSKAKAATSAINTCLHDMYSSDLWLEPSLSHQIGGKGMEFLQLYQQLAKVSHDQGEALYPYMPKAHIVHHVMLRCATSRGAILNPLTFGVQVDEDFIGKKARLARRVGPGQVILRVLQRSLAVSYAYWHEMGFIK
ncbi:unnamed protein product [Durusdinium trenchii]|uniref:Uncharacterized protein n=1 Tax=Durusdinium trenchii TaxID=1381693 RepID=A0ABP0SX63_9DINO